MNAAQVSAVSGWVTAGGNLIAMRPDKQLAGLLGLTDAGTTLASAYLQVDTSSGAGSGIVGSTIQFHGTADRYTLNGATSVATLFSNATTSTGNPAVTLRSVGASGGQAAAFTFDLARSVVYTRQGNPAWAGQERDGVAGIRPDDLFYGARAGDVQPDWVDTNKIAIPQADEQQRLLAQPCHAHGPRQDAAPALLVPAAGREGCRPHERRRSLADPGDGRNGRELRRLQGPESGRLLRRELGLRALDLLRVSEQQHQQRPGGRIHAEGFEVALHPIAGSCPTTPISQAELPRSSIRSSPFAGEVHVAPGPVSSRTHCVFWPDFASNAKVELANGIRMDANYYHYPGSWIGTKNGFMNGGGFPMRFADTRRLDHRRVPGQHEHHGRDDQDYQATIDSLLNNALGSQGYYGAFGMNIHTDNASPHPGAETIVTDGPGARGARRLL